MDVFFRLLQLTEKVDNTVRVISFEAMSSSLMVYDYIKTAANKTPDLKILAEPLEEGFKLIRNPPTNAETNAYQA